MHFLQILVVEGLHPFYDERVRDLLDFKLYLDISDDVKFAWKLQRDSQERGHSVESIKQSIESRKPDFDAYIDPQKKHADIILQVRSHVLNHCCEQHPAVMHSSCVAQNAPICLFVWDLATICCNCYVLP